jgi:hypothetical protein
MFSKRACMQVLLADLTGWTDGFLILFYRITGDPLVDFFFGTAVLSFFCVFAGEFTLSLAIRFNRRQLDEMSREMIEKERLSMEAYQSGDKDSYKALNKQATDAWGKHFFTMAAYSAGILWPIPFALGWMQYRFYDVEFPLTFPLALVFGKSVGYTFIFIPLYIFCRILFKYIRPYLPYFRKVKISMDAYETKASERP